MTQNALPENVEWLFGGTFQDTMKLQRGTTLDNFLRGSEDLCNGFCNEKHWWWRNFTNFKAPAAASSSDQKVMYKRVVFDGGFKVEFAMVNELKRGIIVDESSY